MAHEFNCSSKLFRQKNSSGRSSCTDSCSSNLTYCSSARINIHKIKVGPFMVNQTPNQILSINPKPLFPDYTFQHLNYNEIYSESNLSSSVTRDTQVQEISDNILSALDRERKNIMVIGKLNDNQLVKNSKTVVKDNYLKEASTQTDNVDSRQKD